MLVYSQRSFLRYDRVTRGLNFICELLGKSNQALMPLFSPEDTTTNAGERQLQIARHNADTISGLIKVAFWVAISISIALLIGRLS